MKKLILAGVVMFGLIASISFANIKPIKDNMTDWNCVNKCMSQGYMYGLCVKLCTY